MQIGELAGRAGLNPKTIRYYETIGLLPPPKRTAAGYRQYDDTTVSLLQFVQRAKQLGLSLTEIRTILALHGRGEQPCDHVVTMIDHELARVAERIAALTRLHTELTTLRAHWAGGTGAHTDEVCVCPLIEASPAGLDLPAEWKV